MLFLLWSSWKLIWVKSRFHQKQVILLTWLGCQLVVFPSATTRSSYSSQPWAVVCFYLCLQQ